MAENGRKRNGSARGRETCQVPAFNRFRVARSEDRCSSVRISYVSARLAVGRIRRRACVRDFPVEAGSDVVVVREKSSSLPKKINYTPPPIAGKRRLRDRFYRNARDISIVATVRRSISRTFYYNRTPTTAVDSHRPSSSPRVFRSVLNDDFAAPSIPARSPSAHYCRLVNNKRRELSSATKPAPYSLLDLRESFGTTTYGGGSDACHFARPAVVVTPNLPRYRRILFRDTNVVGSCRATKKPSTFSRRPCNTIGGPRPPLAFRRRRARRSIIERELLPCPFVLAAFPPKLRALRINILSRHL